MGADDAAWFSIVSPFDDGSWIQNPLVRTVLAEQRVFALVVRGFAWRWRSCPRYTRLIIRAHAVVPLIQGVTYLLLGIAEHCFDRVEE